MECLISEWKKGKARSTQPELLYEKFLGVNSAEFVREKQSKFILLPDIVDMIYGKFLDFEKKASEKELIITLNGVLREKVLPNIKNTISSSYSQNNSFEKRILKNHNNYEIIEKDGEFKILNKNQKNIVGTFDIANKLFILKNRLFIDSNNKLQSAGIDNDALRLFFSYGSSELFQIIQIIEGYGQTKGLTCKCKCKLTDYIIKDGNFAYKLDRSKYKNPEKIKEDQTFLPLSKMTLIYDWR